VLTRRSPLAQGGALRVRVYALHAPAEALAAPWDYAAWRETHLQASAVRAHACFCVRCALLRAAAALTRHGVHEQAFTAMCGRWRAEQPE
jgi:hypothetical protein